MMMNAKKHGERTRIVAGFCWRWSDPIDKMSLVPDVKIGDWSRPWNAKRLKNKAYTPANDPYTLWAESESVSSN
jgi:uncharacterized protein